MHPLIQEVSPACGPDRLAERLQDQPGLVLLSSGMLEVAQARYSFVTARPFLTLRSFGSEILLHNQKGVSRQFGDPWHVLDSLMARYELIDELDMPFPLGGCFGYWGYDLKNFVEPRLPRRAVNDLELPDCHVGFYDSLVIFDHLLGKTWVVSTGIQPDGSRDPNQAQRRLDWWQAHLTEKRAPRRPMVEKDSRARSPEVRSNLTRSGFIGKVNRIQRYIRAGDIYQANLAQRLEASAPCGSWEFYQRLSAVSPSPFSAFIDCGEFQLASSSPEVFLRLSGSHVVTRPIKGTRARSNDPTRDAQLTYELQTSDKEMAELVMITDLLRNDLGRFCEYGSVQVPELVRLERYPQVQHLVSTVEGQLRSEITHFGALASCFPGGSITGAPKIRAMEIIDELEGMTRGPYTGCLGYLGFNRESQLSIVIRTAICRPETLYFYVGAGIVSGSEPDAEYDETWAKAGGFLKALEFELRPALAQEIAGSADRVGRTDNQKRAAERSGEQDSPGANDHSKA